MTQPPMAAPALRRHEGARGDDLVAGAEVGVAHGEVLGGGQAVEPEDVARQQLAAEVAPGVVTPTQPEVPEGFSARYTGP